MSYIIVKQTSTSNCLVPKYIINISNKFQDLKYISNLIFCL